MKHVLRLGHKKKVIKEAREAILAILETDATDLPKVEALKTLAHLCAFGPITISGCTFTVNKPD